MPAVVVDSSVLISLAAGEQFQLLRTFYSTIHIPPEVWDEVIATQKRFGEKECRQAQEEGWLIIAQGRRAEQKLGIAYTGTLGVLLRAKADGEIVSLRSVLNLLKERTTFWLGKEVYEAALKHADESEQSKQ